MRGIQGLLSVLALLSLAAPASAYNETDHEDSSFSTHQFIMDQLPAIWETDGHNELAALLRGGWLSDLKRGTIRADQTLWDSREHYMDPNAHQGLLFFAAAGDVAEAQFMQAETAWRAGDHKTAIFYLGWAMHMVQDLTVPHHARLTFLDYHREYEAWVLAHQTELPVATTGIYSIPSGTQGHFVDSSQPFDWVDFAAHESWDLLDGVDGVDGMGDNDYRSVASRMVPFAEQVSAGFLYRMLERLNAPPIADAGPNATTREGMTVVLDAGASSDDFAIREYAWDLPGGRVVSVAASFTPSVAGETTIPLTVTDVFDRTATDFVHVSARAMPTLVLPSVVVGGIGRPVGIEARLSTGETPVEVRWVAPTWQADGFVLNRTFDAPGETRIEVEATLDDGVVVEGSLIVRIVDDEKPLAVIEAPAQALVGQPQTFDGSGSTDNVAVVAYAWRVGDEAAGDGPTAGRVFLRAGTYLVSLEVLDAAGNRGFASHTIVVSAPVRAESATMLDAGTIALVIAIGLGCLAVGIRRHRKRNR